MGDLATRPRGGWQVGTHWRSRTAPEALADEDPAPDVFGVEQRGDTFIVRHYEHAAARRPHCTVTVTRQPGESNLDALTRANREHDRSHQGNEQAEDRR